MSSIETVESTGRVLAASDISAAAQLACLLEASAPKPGNVSPGRRFDDVAYEDFLASAAAIGGPLAGARSRPLGATIRLAVDATACWTRSNTNLGMVLLLAPLARAAAAVIPNAQASADPEGSRDPVVPGLPSSHGFRLAAISTKLEEPSRVGERTMPDAGVTVSGFCRTLRSELRGVLNATTVDDARDVYAAIRRAAPGGLGKVESQDVRTEPDVTLLEAMQLAAGRDGIAREYATAFDCTFGIGIPALDHARGDGLSWSDAIVETFLTLLAAAPDTHVARRGGVVLAASVLRRAKAVLDAGGVRSAAGRTAIDEMDAALRDARHTANPGTTADLTGAAIFVILLAGGWTRSEQQPLEGR